MEQIFTFEKNVGGFEVKVLTSFGDDEGTDGVRISWEDITNENI